MTTPSLYAPMRPAADADRIVIKNNAVYNCFLMPGVCHSENILNEPVWRIERILLTNLNDDEVYTRMYPNGSTSFDFVANRCESYNYSFKK